MGAGALVILDVFLGAQLIIVALAIFALRRYLRHDAADAHHPQVEQQGPRPNLYVVHR
jgi:hypothetical protein